MSGGSFARIGFHVGTDWRVDCHTYDDSTPLFDIDAGTSSVVISIRKNNPDDSAVKFARALVREAQKFAAEVERMHAAQLAEDSNHTRKAAGKSAA
jgi:hypothetical protein